MSTDDQLTPEEIEEELSAFVEELEAEIEEKREVRILKKKPTLAQRKKAKEAAREYILGGGNPETEAILREICADCFDPAAIRFPDHFEEALNYRNCWQRDEDGDGIFVDWGATIAIGDVLKKPTTEQISEVLVNLPKDLNSDDPMPEVREAEMLARTLGSRFPDLIKQTAKAQAFFNPSAVRPAKSPAKRKTGKKKEEGGCFATLLGFAVVVAVVYGLYKMFF